MLLGNKSSESPTKHKELKAGNVSSSLSMVSYSCLFPSGVKSATI